MRNQPYNAIYHSAVCSNFRREVKSKYSIDLCLSDKEIWDIWRKTPVYSTYDEDEQDCIETLLEKHRKLGD